MCTVMSNVVKFMLQFLIFLSDIQIPNIVLYLL